MIILKEKIVQRQLNWQNKLVIVLLKKNDKEISGDEIKKGLTIVNVGITVRLTGLHLNLNVFYSKTVKLY